MVELNYSRSRAFRCVNQKKGKEGSIISRAEPRIRSNELNCEDVVSYLLFIVCIYVRMYIRANCKMSYPIHYFGYVYIYIYVYVYIVITCTVARVRINRIRLPILLVVTHRPIKCLLSCSWSQEVRRSTGRIMVTACYSNQQGSKSRQNPLPETENMGNLSVSRRCHLWVRTAVSTVWNKCV